MPRSPVSRADRELIATLADRGLGVSPYQLERWRTAGLLPRNNRRGLGRGQGSASMVADTTLDLAATLAKQARQGRATVGGHVIERFARGQAIAETRVRASFRAQLDRVARRLAIDAGDGDEGWQARYDAANRLSRNAAIANWERLIDAMKDKPQVAQVTPTDERAAVRTITRMLANEAETSPEELLQAFDTFGADGLDVARMIENQHEAELSGTDNWNELAYSLNLARYRETLDNSSVEDLQHAAETVLVALLLQTMILMMGTWPTMALQTGSVEAVPMALRKVGPDVISRLTSDSMWKQWGRYQGAMTPRAMVIPLTLITLGMLMLPSMFANLQAYRTRLEAMCAEITAAADSSEGSQG